MAPSLLSLHSPPSLLDFLEDIKNIHAGTYSAPALVESSNSDTPIQDSSNDSINHCLSEIQEFSDHSPPSQKHNVSDEVESSSLIANDEIEKELIFCLEQTPRELYEASKSISLKKI